MLNYVEFNRHRELSYETYFEEKSPVITELCTRDGT